MAAGAPALTAFMPPSRRPTRTAPPPRFVDPSGGVEGAPVSHPVPPRMQPLLGVGRGTCLLDVNVRKVLYKFYRSQQLRRPII
jgi:hypothetical protein